MSGGSARVTLLTELATYRENLYWLVQHHEGQWVLIKGVDIVGIFTSEAAACGTALTRFGVDPWLVKQVLRYNTGH